MTTDTLSGYVCEFCDREFTTERGATLHEEQWCKQNPNAVGRMGRPKKEDRPEPTIFDVEPVAETPPQEPGETIPEEPPRRGWREKIWGQTSAPEPGPKTIERPPGRRRRKSTEGIWQVIWTGVGNGLIFTQADIPVGNAMKFQGPVVGPILDKAVTGTFVDKLLQPLAGAGERFEDLSDVLAVPGLVGIMERAPQLAPALEPLLRKAIRRHLVEYARMAKAQRKADAEYHKALEDLGMAPESDDPVDAILADIWSGIPQPAPEPGVNGHTAGADVHP